MLASTSKRSLIACASHGMCLAPKLVGMNFLCMRSLLSWPAGVGAERSLLLQPWPSPQNTCECLTCKGEDATFTKYKNPAFAAYAQPMQTTIARAKTCMLNAQQRQKHYYDRRHVPYVCDAGAEVLLATTILHLRTTGTRKLTSRWVGPNSWLV